MRRFIIERSETDLTSHAGLALVGQALNRHSLLPQTVEREDLDIERLPSGKFATNALVLACSVLAYNILRWLGQRGLTGPGSPVRHPAKRCRIRTVM